MAASPTITLDFPCSACGYNLRGLSPDANCPQCSRPVANTLWTAVLGSTPSQAARYGRLRRSWLQEIAEASGYPQPAISLITDAVAHMRHRSATAANGAEPQPQAPGFSAREFCLSLRDYAVAHFRGVQPARSALTQWKINGSEDIGRIIAALAAAGLLPVAIDEASAGFAGLFTLETLFDPAASAAVPTAAPSVVQPTGAPPGRATAAPALAAGTRPPATAPPPARGRPPVVAAPPPGPRPPAVPAQATTRPALAGAARSRLEREEEPPDPYGLAPDAQADDQPLERGPARFRLSVSAIGSLLRELLEIRRRPVLYENAYVWLVFLSGLDVMLTWVVFHRGGYEANPMAASVINSWGVAGMVVYKFLLVSLVLVICEFVGHRNATRGEQFSRLAVVIGAIPIIWTFYLLLSPH